MCYHAEFGRSVLKGVGIDAGRTPKSGSTGTLLSWDERRGWLQDTRPCPYVLPASSVKVLKEQKE